MGLIEINKEALDSSKLFPFLSSNHLPNIQLVNTLIKRYLLMLPVLILWHRVNYVRGSQSKLGDPTLAWESPHQANRTSGQGEEAKEVAEASATFIYYNNQKCYHVTQVGIAALNKPQQKSWSSHVRKYVQTVSPPCFPWYPLTETLGGLSEVRGGGLNVNIWTCIHTLPHCSVHNASSLYIEIAEWRSACFQNFSPITL